MPLPRRWRGKLKPHHPGDDQHEAKHLHRLAGLMDQAIAHGATADDAEARAIEQIRLLGRELLEDWAQEKQTHSLAQAQAEHPQAIKHIKK